MKNRAEKYAAFDISPYLFFHPIQNVYLQVHLYRKIITVCKSKLLRTVITLIIDFLFRREFGKLYCV